MDAADVGAMVEFAAQHHGVISRTQAATFAVGPAHLRTLLHKGLLSEPAPGVLFVTGSPNTFLRDAMGVTLALDGRGTITGAAGAHLLRFDGFEEPPTRLDVVLPVGRRISTGSLPVRVRHTRAPLLTIDAVMVEGCRVASMERVICDLAARPDRAVSLERLIDHYERTHRPLTRLAQTARRLQATGRTGPAAVLSEIEARRPLRERGERVRGSWFQKLLEMCLAEAGAIHREYEVRDSLGRFVARVDAALPDLRLAIEAHSRRFHLGHAAELRDDDRHSDLLAIGWATTYVTMDQLRRHPTATRRRLSATIAERRLLLGGAS